MPATVVLDHPRWHVGRRVWRRVRTLVGVLVLAIGIAASIVAIPANLAGIAWLFDAESAREIEASAGLSPSAIVLIWIGSTALAIGGVRSGLRLVRAGRTLVLFLRRFGHDNAQLAVTFAVTRTIGTSWRIVTLDDAEMQPLGVPTPTRLIFRTISVAASTGAGLVNVLLRVFPAAQLGLFVVIGVDLALARIWERSDDLEAWTAVLGPYLDIVFATLEGTLPFDALAPDLHGAFAALAIVLASIVLAFAAAPVVWVVSAVLLFVLSFSADMVHAAEGAKTREITTETEIGNAAWSVADRSRKVFGPRLVVMRVASRVWRETVRRFATAASVALIDVSEPTEHLVWEVEELTSTTPTPCVFIGQEDQVMLLADSASAARAGPWHAALAALLDGKEVLAYTADRKGMRRFARALRNRLLSVVDSEGAAWTRRDGLRGRRQRA